MKITLHTFIKRNQDKILLEISRIFFKESIRQMFGYPDLDAGLNTSWFLKIMAFPKPMRHSTLNNCDSGLEAVSLTIVIVLRTIPEGQTFTFPIVLAIVLPPQFLWFKIQCPFDFFMNRKNLLTFIHTFQVIWQYFREISV